MTSNGSAMDAYPSAYRIRNLPFMLLSGLPLNDEAEPGSAQSGEPAAAIITPFKVTSELPVLSSDVARQIKSAFLEATREGDNWDAPTQRDKGGASRVLLKLIGRVCTPSIYLQPDCSALAEILFVGPLSSPAKSCSSGDLVVGAIPNHARDRIKSKPRITFSSLSTHSRFAHISRRYHDPSLG